MAKWASEVDRLVSRACDHHDIRLRLPKSLESPFLSLVMTVAHTQREEHKISKSNCPYLRVVINHSYYLLSHLNWFTSPPHLSLITLQDDGEKSLSLLHHPSPPGLWWSPCSVEIPWEISDGDLDVATNSCASQNEAEPSLLPPGKEFPLSFVSSYYFSTFQQPVIDPDKIWIFKTSSLSCPLCPLMKSHRKWKAKKQSWNIIWEVSVKAFMY